MLQVELERQVQKADVTRVHVHSQSVHARSTRGVCHDAHKVEEDVHKGTSDPSDG
jgi:hypothetical protein